MAINRLIGETEHQPEPLTATTGGWYLVSRTAIVQSNAFWVSNMIDIFLLLLYLAVLSSDVDISFCWSLILIASCLLKVEANPVDLSHIKPAPDFGERARQKNILGYVKGLNRENPPLSIAQPHRVLSEILFTELCTRVKGRCLQGQWFELRTRVLILTCQPRSTAVTSSPVKIYLDEFFKRWQ